MPERHVLYQYASCPFCWRVRQVLQQQSIDIEMRDTLTDSEARRELLAGGGRSTVPCLRIERDGAVHWLYESLDIIDHLQRYYADLVASTAHSNHPTGSNP